jgi:hypothetical integral membrane protein (TIGR02206 family)
MGAFFAKDYVGDPFLLFAPPHLIALSMIFLLNSSFFWLKQHFSLKKRAVFRFILAGILILNELAHHLWTFLTDQWTIQTMLPLHLCSLLVFLSALALLTKSHRIYEFVYFLGIGGALQALLTPDLGIYGFLHFRFFQSFIAHGSIITTAIYLTVIEQFRPTPKSPQRVILALTLYALFVGLINSFLKSNYLFVCQKPAAKSLLDAFGPWPQYLFIVWGLAVILILVLYLPFAFQDWRNARKAVD